MNELLIFNIYFFSRTQEYFKCASIQFLFPRSSTFNINASLVLKILFAFLPIYKWCVSFCGILGENIKIETRDGLQPVPNIWCLRILYCFYFNVRLNLDHIKSIICILWIICTEDPAPSQPVTALMTCLLRCLLHVFCA